MLVVDPRFSTAPFWAAQTGMQLAAFGTIPRLDNEAAWRAWADYVVGLPALAALSAPRSERFADWRVWALQFNEVARLLPT